MKVEELAKELMEVLEEELLLQKKLTALAETKRDALVKIDVKNVENITREETGIILALTKIGQRRVRIISAIAVAVSNKDKMPRVRAVLDNIAEPYKTKIAELSSELKNVMDECARMNRQNKLLIENSLSHIKRFFDAISNAGNTIIYTKRGVANKLPSMPVINAVG